MADPPAKGRTTMKRLPKMLLGVLTVVTSHAWAQAAMTADQSERCATRLSISLTGKSPTSALMSNANPYTDVDSLIGGADFQERFSRFINATFNDDPGMTAVEDPAYYLTKYVLTNN